MSWTETPSKRRRLLTEDKNDMQKKNEQAKKGQQRCSANYALNNSVLTRRNNETG